MSFPGETLQRREAMSELREASPAPGTDTTCETSPLSMSHHTVGATLALFCPYPLSASSVQVDFLPPTLTLRAAVSCVDPPSLCLRVALIQ